MDFVKNFRELKKKHGVQLNKEMQRRGLRYICCSDDEIACGIVAYDAYYAGRSAALEEVRREHKNTVAATEKERSGIVLEDEACDLVAFLRVTKDQKNLLKYLIDNEWLTEVSFTETTRAGWDEP